MLSRPRSPLPKCEDWEDNRVFELAETIGAFQIVSSDDHRADTVVKKQLYEEVKLPRLWMIDPRYDNVEIYHGTEYGLMLKAILAGREILTEPLLPEFQIVIAALFEARQPQN